MPELPEVENIRSTLTRDLKSSTNSIAKSRRAKNANRMSEYLKAIYYLRKDLRFPIPQKKLNNLTGSYLINILRRGKYLLFQFESGIMISHLGMTGQWSIRPEPLILKKHDHLYLEFSKNIFLVYNDPRRFGYIDYLKNLESISTHPLFAHLGAEPLDADMNANYLVKKAHKSSRPIKNFLMDQSIVVGIGNIYASEILFQAHVKPTRLTKSLKLPEWKAVTKAIKDVLLIAIEKGGSTIRDYRMSDGSSGSFQDYHWVYGREDQLCKKCHNKILHKTIAGRATFWCPKCQK